MKYAILLLAVSAAWGQGGTFKPACPEGRVALLVPNDDDSPPRQAWCVLEQLPKVWGTGYWKVASEQHQAPPQSSQNAPLASWNQSPDAPKVDECKAAGMAKGCLHWGPLSNAGNPLVVTCEFGEGDSAKNCRIAEGHTLDDAVNAIINQCRLSVRRANLRHERKMKTLQMGLAQLQTDIQDAKKKAVSK